MPRPQGAAEPATHSTLRFQARAWLRGLLIAVGCVSVVSVFSAGSCESSWCSGEGCYDDDDFDDDDDDFGHATVAANIPSYRLEHFDVVASDESGQHPVALITGIQGLSLGAWAGSTELGESEFVAFTAKVLEHNESLIGLPPEAGRLRFAAVDFEADATLVRYEQVQGDVEADPVPGAELTFRFDLIGHLLTIENSTVL